MGSRREARLYRLSARLVQGRSSARDRAADRRRDERLGDDADGSNPVQVTRFTDGEIFVLRWTADGRSVAVNAGRRTSDAVMIRNFR